MASTADIRNGSVIFHKKKRFKIIKFQHVKPGKGGAFAQIEMKAIASGTKLNERFRSEDKLEKAHVEPRQMQYLYPEGEFYVFMDLETKDQMPLAREDLAQHKNNLLPSLQVLIASALQRYLNSVPHLNLQNTPNCLSTSFTPTHPSTSAPRASWAERLEIA